jgi:HlyD family secretion protein
MKKKIIIALPVILIIAFAIYYFFFSSSKKNNELSFGDVTRGNITQTILSTGTLQAVSTVDVGTQVSGKVIKLFVDFNDNVKKGQLLAIVDTTNLVTQVRDAHSALEKANADFHQATVTHEKNKKLYELNYISELDFLTSQTNVESMQAAVSTAESALERAKINLGYAYIYAPISGKIQNRSIEAGQTVAASLSAPTLFTIAEDLSSMEILVSVDESDIGQVALGQKVDFTVQAYPDKKFWGEVSQIRINSTVVSNVVNYTVVVRASNNENILLPGMTATVDFYIQERNNVILVPNAALRFQPSDDLLAEYKSESEKASKYRPDSLKKAGQAQAALGGKAQGTKSQYGRIWYIDENKKLKKCPVVLGITDGKMTEIVKGNDIKEGMKIITGLMDNTTKATTPAGNSLTGAPAGGQPGMRRGL